MTQRPYSVLFLCTGNSARSILAESILNKLGHGRYIAYSAGSMPKGNVNPYAIKFLNAHGYETSQLRSKPWDEFAVINAPHIDFVVTVCDNAAGEVCPIWPGKPMKAHWGIPDPAAAEGSDEHMMAVFSLAHEQLKKRIEQFLALPIDTLSDAEFKQRVNEIGNQP